MTKRIIVEMELGEEDEVIEYFIVRLDDSGPWFDRVSAVAAGSVADADGEYELLQDIYVTLDAKHFL